MNNNSVGSKEAADNLVKNICRKTARKYSAEGKICIVLAGLRDEESIAALCRREGTAESLYYKWSKEFLEAGARHLSGNTARFNERLSNKAMYAGSWKTPNVQPKTLA